MGSNPYQTKLPYGYLLKVKSYGMDTYKTMNKQGSPCIQSHTLPPLNETRKLRKQCSLKLHEEKGAD
jgi:hypothetical protein